MEMKCVEGCFKCCIDTSMELTEEDIRRIEGLGYNREYFVTYWDDGIPRLRNVDGACVFLDRSSGLCRIYRYRPYGCRIYPVVYDFEKGFIKDPICPAVDTIDDIEFRGRVYSLKWVLDKLSIRVGRDDTE